MDLQTLAQEMLAQFETKTRDGGGDFRCLKEGHPDWMQDVARAAHGDMLPDDHRYEMIHTSLNAIVDSDGDTDSARDALEPDVYSRDLLAWLSSNLSRADYCNAAVEDGTANLKDFNLFNVIAVGQLAELTETFSALVEALEERLSEIE